jgi:hypothetical protein
MLKLRWARTLPYLCLAAGLIFSLWQFPGSARPLVAQNAPTGPNSIELTTEQLPPVDGTIPVALQCQTQDYLKPAQGKALRCLLKNNTRHPITAVSLSYNITYQMNGQKSTNSGFVTMDALIHSDFRDSNFSKFILPGAESDIQSRRVIEETMSDIKIIITIDYLEFDNAEPLGRDSNGSRLLKEIRDGAVKYKGWLKQNYLASGRSMSSVKALLEQTRSVATDLGIDGQSEIGAESYRRYARDIINFRGGASELEKYLLREK